VNADLERIWKEAIMVYIVSTQYLHKESEDRHFLSEHCPPLNTYNRLKGQNLVKE
jgi:hypothetical protein